MIVKTIRTILGIAFLLGAMALVGVVIHESNLEAWPMDPGWVFIPIIVAIVGVALKISGSLRS